MRRWDYLRRIVLDQGGVTIGSRFGAGGTLMAVLMNSRGWITFELTSGVPQVLAPAGAANMMDAWGTTLETVSFPGLLYV